MTTAATTAGELELAGWRRQVAELYAAVRQAPTPQDGHALWRAGRDRLFQEHPQSPLAPDDRLRAGLPYAPYDPAPRWKLAVQPAETDQRLAITTGPARPRTYDASVRYRRRSTPGSPCGGLSSAAAGCSSRSATRPPARRRRGLSD